jgi:hypothetical protein
MRRFCFKPSLWKRLLKAVREEVEFEPFRPRDEQRESSAQFKAYFEKASK